MRPQINLAIQLAAVVLSAIMRLAHPGWIFAIFFVLFPIGSLAMIAQIVLASVAMRRRRLTAQVSVAFGLLAASLVAGNGFLMDLTDRDGSEHSPFGFLFGFAESNSTFSIAILLMVTWFITLFWLIGGLVASRPQVPAVPVPFPPYQPCAYGPPALPR